MRSFLAADISGDAKRLISETTAILSARCAPSAIRWVETEQLHITLHFLGADVDRERIQHLVAGGADLVRDSTPVELTLGGVVTLPSNGLLARVIYVGVAGRGIRQLDVIRNRFTLLLNTLKIPVDNRPWHPHVTIGRLRQPSRLHMGPVPSPPATNFTVDGLTLFASTLTSSGPHYKPLHVFPFHDSPSRQPHNG